MKTSSTLSIKTQIFSLFLVIASAVFVAFAVAAIMINRYESSKTYLLKNVLLSPKSIEALDGFNLYDYSTRDSTAKTWKQFKISNETYNEFYSLIEGDTSLELVPDDVLDFFSLTSPATLTLFLHTKANEFEQKVQFAKDSDYYRVELHMETTGGHPHWSYFYHPSIDKDTESLFTRKSS